LPDEPWRQQPHEAGETNDLDPVRFEFALQRALERLAVVAERTVIDHRGRDAGRGGTLEPGGRRLA
jgi:hypothetical protein